MRPIGWTLTCTLLATTFPKSALASSVQRGGLVADEAARAKVTKLLPIPIEANLDPDIRSLRDFLDDLFSAGENDQETTGREGRTFGHKRLQFMLMPMMYKMGVMMTMLTVLTVISLKGLLIGAILLMLKLSTIIAKFSSGWQHHAQGQQPIHVHVHNSLPAAHHQAYSGWIGNSGPEEDEHYYYRG